MAAQIIKFPTRKQSDARPSALPTPPPASAEHWPTPPAPAPAKPALSRRGQEEAAQRKGMLARLHIEILPAAYAEVPGFNETAYRQGILSINYGVESAGALNNQQLRSLLLELKEMIADARRGMMGKRPAKVPGGDKGAPKALFDAMDHRYPRFCKIEAQLAEKAAQEKKYVGWGYALGIVKRQSKGVITDLDDATAEALDGVIAALNRDALRKKRYTEQWGY